MPGGSSRAAAKPKPTDVASETKRQYIPLIKKEIQGTYSYLYVKPLEELEFDPNHALTGTNRPTFYVCTGDPVDVTLDWSRQTGVHVAFICQANDRRPGGDWETGVVGYEEKLCRRSSLSTTLATPGPGSPHSAHFPIPVQAGIFSPQVVVFRGPHDTYEKLPRNQWQDLPVCSIPPMRRPKICPSGQKYSFEAEREMVKNKLRAALRICLYNGCQDVVVGDFGLGSAGRNPPLELAELWREVFLFDPDMRGRIRTATFAFEDVSQSTSQMILDELAKKAKPGGSSSGSGGGASSSSKTKGKGKAKATASSSSSVTPGSGSSAPTDYQIFSHVFSDPEVDRIVTQPDPRYGLGMITLP